VEVKAKIVSREDIRRKTEEEMARRRERAKRKQHAAGEAKATAEYTSTQPALVDEGAVMKREPPAAGPDHTKAELVKLEDDDVKNDVKVAVTEAAATAQHDQELMMQLMREGAPKAVARALVKMNSDRDFATRPEDHGKLRRRKDGFECRRRRQEKAPWERRLTHYRRVADDAEGKRRADEDEQLRFAEHPLEMPWLDALGVQGQLPLSWRLEDWFGRGAPAPHGY
jgi:hypothetical protein